MSVSTQHEFVNLWQRCDGLVSNSLASVQGGHQPSGLSVGRMRWVSTGIHWLAELQGVRL